MAHRMVNGQKIDLTPAEEAAEVVERAAQATEQAQNEADKQARDNRRKVEDVSQGLPATNAKVQEIIDVLRESGIYLTP